MHAAASLLPNSNHRSEPTTTTVLLCFRYSSCRVADSGWCAKHMPKGPDWHPE